MAKPVRRARVIEDPTIYPTEDNMGESALQRFVSELLRALVVRWLAGRKVKAFVGANQFIYYVQHNSREAVAPDVYVIPGAPAGACPKSWKTWADGVVPSFAFECVSDDVPKDYEDSPRRYDALGVRELVIYDPEFRARRDRHRWQVFRRVGRRGLVPVEVTNGDRVRSRALGCWLRVVGDGDATRVRLATGDAGETLLPTADEEAEQERAAKEQERAAREQAEAEVLRLRDEIARLKRRR